MNSMLSYNARRIAQAEARANEILDYIRANPKASQARMLKTLAKRWRVTERTARIPLEYLKRHKLIESRTVVETRLSVV